jgi:hypothetical protein
MGTETKTIITFIPAKVKWGEPFSFRSPFLKAIVLSCYQDFVIE